MYELYKEYMISVAHDDKTNPAAIESIMKEYEKFQRNYELLQTFSNFEAIVIFYVINILLRSFYR